MHDTTAGSIGKADSKAAFLASLDAAILAGVVTVTNLDELGSAAKVLVLTGGGLLAVALLLAMAVVVPVLRSRHTKTATAGDFLYFGAVRRMSPAELAHRLASEDTLTAVNQQSITLARLSWHKHRLMQAAMTCTALGANLVGWTLLLAGA